MGTAELGFESSVIKNCSAFQHVLCNFEVKLFMLLCVVKMALYYQVCFVHSISWIQYLGWGCVFCLLLRNRTGATLPCPQQGLPSACRLQYRKMKVSHVLLPKLVLAVSLMQLLLSQLSRAVKLCFPLSFSFG